MWKRGVILGLALVAAGTLAWAWKARSTADLRRDSGDATLAASEKEDLDKAGDAYER